jgi:adenosine deaminase
MDVLTGEATMPRSIEEIRKVELHQHVDGSIPPEVTWRLMKSHGLDPVPTLREMRRLLQLQPGEEGSLLAYLDKFHYPMWITQFYENIQAVTRRIVEDAYAHGVRLLELRYSPAVHTYAGLTPRQAIRSVLSGMNTATRRHADLEVGLIIISMRQHGPHIAKIIARQALAEAQHLHERAGVVGFDLAGAERGNPPRLYREAYDIARRGGLGLTVHAGEDEGPHRIWEAVDQLGADRIGHGCSAIQDRALLRRLARDRILVECCLTSNYQTGAVPRGTPHPIFTFLEHGIPVAVCTDNTTVSDTDQTRENRLLLERLTPAEIAGVHRAAADHSFVRRIPSFVERSR